MLVSRAFSFGAILGAFWLSVTSVACDSGTADGDARLGTTPKSSDPGGGDGEVPVAALALAACSPATYALPVRIGDSEPFDVALDTGSTSLAVASSSCDRCDVVPKFSPGADVVDQGVQAKAQYVTGRWSGTVYEGDVSVDAQTRATMKFVAIEDQQGFFVDQRCGTKSGGLQGIIGFGQRFGAVGGTTGFFDRFVAETESPDVFATELCDAGGTLWLGGYDATRTTAEPKFTPLLNGAFAYYAVLLASVEVEGTTVPIASRRYARTAVDTGASVFLLPRAAFDRLATALASNASFKALFGEDASWFETRSAKSCKEVSTSKEELDAKLPPLTLTFGSEPDVISVRAAPTESYLASERGRWCSTLASFDPSEDIPLAAVMGAPVMRSNIVVFDRENRRVGFAPHAPCR